MKLLFLTLLTLNLFLFFSFDVQSKPKSPPVSREGAILLFKERHFMEAQSQLNEWLRRNPEDDELRYILASTQAQLGRNQDALENLEPLLMKDPFYYLYKVDFDADFDLVRNLEPFVKGLSPFQPVYLAVDKYSKDRMAQTDEGLILYHHGLKILLHQSSREVDNYDYSAGFIDRDRLYYSLRTTTDKTDKQNRLKSGENDVDVRIYSRHKRTETIFSQTENRVSDPISLIFPVASPLKSQ